MRLIYCAFSLLLSGCIGDLGPRECAANTDCVKSGQPGVCRPSPSSSSNFCAFDAAECNAHLRWGALAGDRLANSCVNEISPYDAGRLDAGALDGADGSNADAGSPPDAGPARIILDQQAYEFGAVRPDQSVMRTFTITNAGGLSSGPLSVSIGGADPSAFALAAAACNGRVLQAGTGCDVTVTFSTATAGSRSATLMVSADAGGSTAATLTGSGLAPAALSAEPPALAFGTVTTGSNSTLGVSIRNNGALDTGLLTTLIDGTDAASFTATVDGCKGKPLPAGSSCSITVAFASTMTGSKGAKLTVGDGNKKVEVALGANAVTPGALTMMPSVPTFSDVAIGSTTSAVVTVKNNGGTTVTGLGTTISGTAASDFNMSPNNCSGQDLAAGSSCTVTIRFSPTVAGVKTASFAVSGSSGGSTSTSLSANATARLAVTIAGAGTGSVASNPVGLQCMTGATNGCTFDFATATVVLTANPSSNSTFAGWSGAGCGTTSPCTVSMTAAKGVTATFALRQYTVTVQRTGSGAASGLVTSSPTGVDCGSTCSTVVTAGNTVTLQAHDTADAAFQGWSGGGCTGKAACVISPSADVTVSADFKAIFTMYTTVNGCFFCTPPPGLLPGRITSNPPGLDADENTVAQRNLLDGDVVDLTAIPGPGAVFSGWLVSTSQPTDRVAAYQLRYTNPRSFVVSATQVVSTWFGDPVDVTVSVSGGGTVTSIPAGISCTGGTGQCTAAFGRHANILLRSSRSASWSGVPGNTCADGTLCEALDLPGTTTVSVTFP